MLINSILHMVERRKCYSNTGLFYEDLDTLRAAPTILQPRPISWQEALLRQQSIRVPGSGIATVDIENLGWKNS